MSRRRSPGAFGLCIRARQGITRSALESMYSSVSSMEHESVSERQMSNPVAHGVPRDHLCPAGGGGQQSTGCTGTVWEEGCPEALKAVPGWVRNHYRHPRSAGSFTAFRHPFLIIRFRHSISTPLGPRVFLSAWPYPATAGRDSSSREGQALFRSGSSGLIHCPKTGRQDEPFSACPTRSGPRMCSSRADRRPPAPGRADGGVET